MESQPQQFEVEVQKQSPGLIPESSSFWRRATATGISARNKLEDVFLEAQIPTWIRRHLTFYRLHFAYFFLLTVFGASTLYLAHRSDKGERHFSLVDAVFNAVSIVTVTGITSVRIADFSTFDRILLLILMTLGSPVLTSLLPLYVRRFYFFRHCRKFVKNQHTGMTETSHHNCLTGGNAACGRMDDSILELPSVQGPPHEEKWTATVDSDAPSETSVGDAQRLSIPLSAISPGHKFIPDDHGFGNHAQECGLSEDKRNWHPEVGSKSAVNETEARVIYHLNGIENHKLQRGEPELPSDHAVGGAKPWIRGYFQEPCGITKTSTMEQLGLVTLCRLVPAYLLITQVACFVLSLLIFSTTPHAKSILQERSINTVLFSVSTTIASFTNSGVPAHDDNMVPLQNQCVLLVLYTLVSLMGNLLYPPCMRVIIWVLRSFASNPQKAVYNYLLDHPRRCFTHLFPCRQSVWLGLTVVGFSAIQLIFFCSLDWHSDALAGLKPISKIVDGIYQSVSVRNAGGAVVTISKLSSSMLVLYLFMMFVAAYPVSLLRQNSTEYDQADLSVYHNLWDEKLTDNSIAFQSRKLLAKDSVFLCAVLFLICAIESTKIKDDPLNYSIFNIIFEVVSAYGGVGMSIGYKCSLRLAQENEVLGPCTDVPYSFSGKWSCAGRMVLATAMFFGRHRGLPDDIDSAVTLPSFKTIPLGKKSAASDSTTAHGSKFEDGISKQFCQRDQHQSQMDDERQLDRLAGSQEFCARDQIDRDGGQSATNVEQKNAARDQIIGDGGQRALNVEQENAARDQIDRDGGQRTINVEPENAAGAIPA